jgi:hypothetical protein
MVTVILTSIHQQHGYGGLDGVGASVEVEAGVVAEVGGGGDLTGMVGGKLGFS